MLESIVTEPLYSIGNINTLDFETKKPKSVFIVGYMNNYAPYTIQAVFSTKQKAEQYLEQHKQELYKRYFAKFIEYGKDKAVAEEAALQNSSAAITYNYSIQEHEVR